MFQLQREIYLKLGYESLSAVRFSRRHSHPEILIESPRRHPDSDSVEDGTIHLFVCACGWCDELKTVKKIKKHAMYKEINKTDLST